MRIIRTLDELQAAARPGRTGPGGVLVPTMGALHAGHTALIQRAAALSRTRRLEPGAVVSIFVNPTQFNDPSDLARYPRTLEADLAACRQAGAALIFAPDQQTMYPPDQPVNVPPLPVVATEPELEDTHRPGHFAGVCQVVMRLFELLQPGAAVFGEKDWQQLQVVRAMVHEANLPIEIIDHPTVRDPDGLAMSSRNRFLSEDQRKQALTIPTALNAAAACDDPMQAERTMRERLAGTGVQIEYAVVRDARTLGPLTPGNPGRALVAARIGPVRLLDNAPWPGPNSSTVH